MKSDLDPRLLKIVDRVTERVFDLDFAGMIIIDGGVGQGKTTLAVKIADYINGAPIDFDEQLSMGGHQFQQKLEKCFRAKRKVIIYDEAGDFNKRASLTRFNSELNRTFETFRAFKIVIILILPFFGSLDDQIFYKEIPRLLIHTYGRNKQRGRARVFSLRRIFYIRHAMKKAIIKPEVFFKQQANLDTTFSDLDKTRSKELTTFSIKGKHVVLRESIIKQRGYKTLKELANMFMVKKKRIQAVFYEEGIKAAIREGGQVFYKPEDYLKLKDHINMRGQKLQVSR